MSEQEVNEVEESEIEIEESEVAVEEKAVPDEQKSGHLTYEAFIDKGGVSEDYMGPQAYDKHGKLIKEIQDLKREYRLSKHTTDTLLSEWQKTKEEKRVDEFRTMQTQRQEALELGNVDQADQLTDQMGKLEQVHQKEQAKVQQQGPQIDPNMVDFLQRHPEWFDPDIPPKLYMQIPKSATKLQQFGAIAQNVSSQMAAEGKDPNVHTDVLVERVEKLMVQVHGVPEETQAPKREISSPQSSAVNKSAATSGKKLSRNQTDEYRTLKSDAERNGYPCLSVEEFKNSYCKKYDIK